MDSDNSGEGDVQGIISKLQHLKDLGVTGTWLNPIFKSPMKGVKIKLWSIKFKLKFVWISDGGYDIADFLSIDPRYGNLTDVEELFAKAKELGIRVLLDLVSLF